MSELKQLREIKDQPLNVIRWALTPAGAKAVIERAFGSMPDNLRDESAQELVKVAMVACGIDLDEMTEGTESGNVGQDPETS